MHLVQGQNISTNFAFEEAALGCCIPCTPTCVHDDGLDPLQLALVVFSPTIRNLLMCACIQLAHVVYNLHCVWLYIVPSPSLAILIMTYTFQLPLTKCTKYCICSLQSTGSMFINVPPCVANVGSSMYTLLSFKTAEATCMSQGTAGMLALLCVLVVGSEKLAYIQQVNSWKSTNSLEGLSVWNFTDRSNGDSGKRNCSPA